MDALFHISEGFYFGPHHLIMASLIHFEEKVHRKKLQRVDTIPLLFPRLLCQILEYLGFPTEPRLERPRLCRERSTLDKWNQLVGYSVPPGVPPMVAPPVHPRLEQGELSTETTPLVPTPKATSTAPPTTPTVPPVVPTTSEPSITISASEFRALVHTFHTLTTTHSTFFQQMVEMCAHQDQQTTILRQIQQYLGLLPSPQPDLPASSAPIAPFEDTTPAEVRIPPPQDEPPTVTTMPEGASSPLEAPTV